MSAITQNQKQVVVNALNLVKTKLDAFGLNPNWNTGATDVTHPDGSLAYDVERTALTAALVAANAVLVTWLT